MSQGENGSARLRGLALSVARCPEVPLARDSTTHPCRKIVSLQPADPSTWQVPEAWAGALSTARVFFLSLNPSISEAGDAQSGGIAELHPTGDWADDDITDFMVNRFAPDHGYATPDGRFRRQDGSWSPKRVAFWTRVRKRAGELLGPDASPDRDYAMTEVVHCKSKREAGVDAALDLCASLHLNRVIAASPAPLVVLGSRARDRARSLWNLGAGFGAKSNLGTDERASLAVRRLGGRDRVVAYLTHPCGMTSPQTFAASYPQHLLALRAVVAGEVPVPHFAGELEAQSFRDGATNPAASQRDCGA